MRVTLDVPASSATLSAALEGLTALAYQTLERGSFRPLYFSGVKYKPEPRIGGRRKEEWWTPDRIMKEGWGDCEDLAAWRAAELRQKGIPARAVAKRTGRKMFHAVVLWPNGTTEDPSRVLGMKRRRR